MNEQQIKSNEPVEQVITEEQKQAWKRSTLENAQKFLAQQGLIPESIFEGDSRYLPPLFALWKIKCQNGRKYWVISGRLPTDVIDFSAASNARDAIRYISYQWQMKAQGIIDSGVRDKLQIDFANLLVNRAHGLYEIAEKDQMWVNEQTIQ
ncbi:hypothetical protein PALB_30190 [Pseudoalteromonas luteoviolacea B = ATCC 29581]|nr:hypothetical protein PALB_30190 [Pseudoalteromonas luteoviolacea B = ATCC 29581]